MNRHIILGLWPMAGITTVGVSRPDAERTVRAAIDSGITDFDTAFSYGYEGECDQLLGAAIASKRNRFRIIGKVGQRWGPDRARVIDGSPAALTSDAELSLRRIGVEYFDTLLLHSPDPGVPIEKSADALSKLQERGLCHRIGACNVTAEQYQQFSSVTPCHAIQCPLNVVQQERRWDLIPVCHENGTDVYVFWTLMKGLLAGKIRRDHDFDPEDVRPGYPIFQGEARERTHRLLDRLQSIASQTGNTIAQLTVGWAISQPGVTAALVGARRPDQIQETAQTHPLSSELLSQIDGAVVASSS